MYNYLNATILIIHSQTNYRLPLDNAASLYLHVTTVTNGYYVDHFSPCIVGH